MLKIYKNVVILKSKQPFDINLYAVSFVAAFLLMFFKYPVHFLIDNYSNCDNI